jgi:2-desacetyl-2-hydroxyethyl bacteriochlorophyllide A dehydrogenase
VKSIVLTAPHAVDVRETPEPDDVGAVVELEQAGICGTDVKIFHGDVPVATPRVMGHELVGRVVREGPLGLHPVGTRVLVDPALSCGHCVQCRAGRSNLCTNGGLMGRDAEGVFAERVALNELRLHPVPDAIPTRAAALLQVLGTCIHAQAQLPVFPPEHAVVIGLGVAGLLHVQLLRARGVASIVGVSRSPEKRALGEASGATATAPPDRAEEAVRAATDGNGASTVIEAVGTVPTLAQALRVAAPGASILVFGTITGSRADDVPFYQLYHKELRLLNPRAALPGDYDRGIALAAAGALDLEPLWSHSFPLSDPTAAFGAVETGGALKVTFTR